MVRHSILLLAFVIAIGLAGCGGGGGGGTGGGGGVAPGVTLIVGADASYSTGGPSAKLFATAGSKVLNAPLDDGALVSVYNFATGELIKTGTISNGWCTLENIPSGLSLAIVVTGKRGGKNYRLSTLVPVVLDTQAEYVANPLTSIAAEAFSAEHFAKNKVFSESDLAPVLEKAKEFVQDNLSADFSIGGGVFTDAGFGKPNSLNTSAPGINEVIQAVKPVNDKLARGKNTITLLEEAGVPMREMLDPEALDFQNVFTEEVLSKYQALGETMGRLLGPAIVTELRLNGNEVNITGLTVGRKYVVTSVDPDSGHLILSDRGTGTAGYITIQRTVPDEGTYTLVAKHEGSNWVLTQTCSGDSQQQYKFTVTDKILQDEMPGANPTISGTLSARDKNFTTPVTMQVTAAATGSDPDSYTAVTFNGSFSTPEVSVTGSMSAQFATSKPSGAAEWQNRYEFVTAFNMTNGRITVKVGSKAITLQGNLSAKSQFVKLSDMVTTVPSEIQFTGGYSNTHTGLTFTGTMTFNATWVEVNDGAKPSTGSATITGTLGKPDHPKYALDLSLNKTTQKLTGAIDLTAAVISFKGSATGTIDGTTGDLKTMSVVLNASTGAVITYSRDATGKESGQIKVDDTKVADITFPQNAIRINFTDGTFKEFVF